MNVPRARPQTFQAVPDVAAAAGPGQAADQEFRKLAGVYNHLTGMALQGADMASITAILAERVGNTVVVVDEGLTPMAVSSPDHQAAPNPRLWAANRRLQPALGSVAETRRALHLPGAGASSPALVVAPIVVGDEILAYVLNVKQDPAQGPSDFDLLVTEYAATVFAVVMSRDRMAADVAARVRDDLVDAMLLGRIGDRDEGLRWAEHLGYDPGRAYRVFSISAADAGQGSGSPDAAALRRRAYLVASQLVGGREPDAIVSARADETVVLAPVDAAGQRRPSVTALDLAEYAAAQLGQRFPQLTFTIGVGAACRDPSEVTRSYREARRAVQAALSLGRAGQVVAFDKLGIYRLLLLVPDLRELTSVSREVLGPVLDYEQAHQANLVGTLTAYLQHNGSLQGAAQELHVHPNTVGYRLRRIEEITQLDLANADDRLMIQVALKILEGLPRTEERHHGR